MFTCKNCNSIFETKYGPSDSGDFCSKKCARTYSQSFVKGNKHITCCWCEKEFDADIRSSSKNVCCSDECYREKRKHRTICNTCGSKYGECPRPETYDVQNMMDKVRRYRELGYGFRLILEHEDVIL